MRLFRGGSNIYILVPGVAPVSDADTWEFSTRTNYCGSGSHVLFSGESQYHNSDMWNSSRGYQGYKVPRLYVNNTNNDGRKLILNTSLNGTNWGVTVTSSTSLDAYEKYNIKCGFDGTNYYIKQQRYYDGSNPLITSNGTMGGSTPACSSSNYNSYQPWNAFNGNWSYWDWGWSVDSWITYYTPTAISPTGIAIRNYNQSNHFKTAIFQGSNDNTNWTDIKTLSNVNSNNIETYWSIICVKSYKYFRLLFKEKYGTDSRVYIRRIKIFGFGEECWEDWITTSVANSTKCVWSRPFILFNQFDNLSNNYMSGWSKGDGTDREANNLSETSLKYTKDGVTKTWFSGDEFTDIGVFNFNCNVDQYKVVTGFSTLNYLCTNKVMIDGNNSKNKKWIFRVYVSSPGTTQRIISESDGTYCFGLVNNKWHIWFNNHCYCGGVAKADTWYWVAIECENNTYRFYTMEDDDKYYLSILPNFPQIILDSEGRKKLEPSDWNFEFRLDAGTHDLFNTKLVYLGFNPGSTGEYWRGKIDLKGCLIGSNMIRAMLSKPTYFPANVHLDSSDLNSIEYVDMIPSSEGATFTLVPTPSDATVELISKGAEQYNNSILVKPGADIKYHVSAADCYDSEGVYTCNENISYPVVLDQKQRVNVKSTYAYGSGMGVMTLQNILTNPIQGNVPYSLELMFRLPEVDTSSSSRIKYYYSIYTGASWYNSLYYEFYHEVYSGTTYHTHGLFWTLPSSQDYELFSRYQIMTDPELGVDYRLKLFSEDGITHRFSYRIPDKTKYWTDGIITNQGSSYWYAGNYYLMGTSDGYYSYNTNFKLYIDMCKLAVNNTTLFDGSTAVQDTDYTLSNCTSPIQESVII